MVTPLFVSDVDAAFTSCPSRRNKGHPFCESTYESRLVADNTFRSPSVPRCPTSRRSPGTILCTGSIPYENANQTSERLKRVTDGAEGQRYLVSPA
jgi:hypothetical protein